ncbi:MAG: PEP-CTERM sorting domain-containing protein [Bryobacteraceae bacterium]
MRLRSAIGTAILSLSCGLSLQAATVYNEAVQGDFSNSGLSPTQVTVATGSNQIIGTTGNSGSGTDRDYFTITVPTGLQMTALMEVAGTTVGGAVSFIGLQAGNQVTLPTNTQTANGLLGWSHYGGATTDTDLFAVMSVPSNGSSGFTAPLNAGNYSFWIQDFNAGSFSYTFNLVLAPAASPVPEPKSYAMMLAGFVALVFLCKRRQRAIS